MQRSADDDGGEPADVDRDAARRHDARRRLDARQDLRLRPAQELEPGARHRRAQGVRPVPTVPVQREGDVEGSAPSPLRRFYVVGSAPGSCRGNVFRVPDVIFNFAVVFQNRQSERVIEKCEVSIVIFQNSVVIMLWQWKPTK